QSGERVIDHGLVIDREQLFRDHSRYRVKPSARAPRENDAFHTITGFPSSAATTARVRSRQCSGRILKTRKSFEQSSSELAGRGAAVGYSAEEIGVTRGRRPVNPDCAARISSA